MNESESKSSIAPNGSMNRIGYQVKVTNDFSLGRCKLTSSVNHDRDALEAKYVRDLNFQLESLNIAQKNENGAKIVWERRVKLAEGTLKPTAEDSKLMSKTPAQVRELYEVAFNKRVKAEEARDKAQDNYNKYLECDEIVVKPSDKNVWLENNIPVQQWSSAPRYMAPYMPMKEEPGPIFIQIVRSLTADAERADHDQLITLLDRYR